MKFIREKLQTLGNKGLSMVELICAIAIVSLLGTTIASMMVVSANSYRRGSAEADVQQEAQMVANQISDLIIDVTKSVELNAAKDVLTINQNDEFNTKILISYVNKTVTYTEYLNPGTSAEEVYGPQLMAENVTSFVPDITDFSSRGYFTIQIDVDKDGHSYPNFFTITSRNAVRGGDSDEAAAKVKILLTQKKWLAEPNQKIYIDSFATLSTGGSGILWTIGSGYADDTVVGTDASGTYLQVGADEMNSTIKLTANAAGASPAVVNVFVRRANTISAAAVLQTGSANAYAAGDVYKVVPTVTGSFMAQIPGAPYDVTSKDDKSIAYFDPKEVKYSISGGTASGKITLSGDGKVILNEAFEANEYVMIRVTSRHAAVGEASGAYYNRTGIAYNTTLWVDVKIGKTMSFVNVAGDDGWRRYSDTKQAAVDMSAVSAYLGKNNLYHDYTVEYWKVTDGPVTNVDSYIQSHGAGSLMGKATIKTSGSDAFNSSVLNIRPIVSGYMDYRYDYVIRINWQVHENDENGAILWEESIVNVMKKISVAFNGTSTYFTSGVIDSWGETKAQEFEYIPKDVNMLTLNRTAVTGIPDDRIGNEIIYDLYKKEGSTYTKVDARMFQENAIAKTTGYIYEPGDYCIMVTAKIMKEVFDDTGKLVSGPYEVKPLYDPADMSNDTGRFYFKVTGYTPHFDSSGTNSFQKNNMTSYSASEGKVLKFTKDQTVNLMSVNDTYSKNEIIDGNNIDYEVYHYESGSWVKSDKLVSTQSGKNCNIKATDVVPEGLYCVKVIDKSKKIELSDFTTGRGIYCFWVGAAGETPEGVATPAPSASPSPSPSASPSASPSTSPSASPSTSPSASPSTSPSAEPSTSPSSEPSGGSWVAGSGKMDTVDWGSTKRVLYLDIPSALMTGETRYTVNYKITFNMEIPGIGTVKNGVMSQKFSRYDSGNREIFRIDDFTGISGLKVVSYEVQLVE